MPNFDTSDLENFKLPTGNYGFSGTRMEELDATEYTLVTLVQDDSSSVASYRDEMENCIKTIVDACQKSPRADNLMIRFVRFSNNMEEVHGFKRLSTINKDDYSGCLGLGGMTALYDATENAVKAMTTYSEQLVKNDFSTNGILFVVTDGADNVSKLNPNAVADAFRDSLKQEMIESLVSVLIGVNIDPNVDQYLQAFHKEAGFTQYVNIGNATSQKLAKLAEFVSKSVSAQSQNVSSGKAAPVASIKF